MHLNFLFVKILPKIAEVFFIITIAQLDKISFKQVQNKNKKDGILKYLNLLRLRLVSIYSHCALMTLL